MRTGNNSANTAGKKGPGKIKIVKWIVMVAVVFILLLVLVIPVYLSSESGKRFRPPVSRPDASRTNG